MTPVGRRRLARVAQVVGSVGVLWVLARDVESARLAEVAAAISPAWLAAAIAAKSAGLFTHEFRLWLALPRPRPPVGKVIALGMVAGMLNLVLPARGGDLAAIALLNRETKVPVATATAAVGLVTFLEAAVFGLMLIAVLIGGAARWEAIIGAQARSEAVTLVTALTLGGIGVAVATAMVGRLLGRRDAPEDRPTGGPLGLLRDTAAELGAGLSSPVFLVQHLALAVLQVVLVLGAFALALPGVGLDVPLPLLAAAGVLTLASLASVVLPPTFGAGPAAASTAVLTVFGVDPAGALAYAGAWWLVAHLPAVALGLPCLGGRTAALAGAVADVASKANDA